jgi:tetratricopeptide (TPR) repeat protein
MKHSVLLALFSLWFTLTASAEVSVDSLLRVLDVTLTNASSYEATKLARIRELKMRLNALPPSAIDSVYSLNRQLYMEYETYICDSARHYINRNLDIARRSGRIDRFNETLLRKAAILNRTGLYVESMTLLRSIHRNTLLPTQQKDYYIAFGDAYLYCAEYAVDNEYQPVYLEKLYAYRDTVLQIVPKGSFDYICAYAPQLLQQGNSSEAIHQMKTYLPRLSTDTRDYAVLTSILAFAYRQIENVPRQKEYLIRSATADARAVVKEHNSLRELAELLYEEGQIERANRYMKHCMEDANFYNARLRNVQASRMLPIIDRAYQAERVKQEHTVQLFLILACVLALCLAGAVWYVIRQMKKLSRVNCTLAEANRIKEEYVVQFMNLCSTYIDKLEVYRRMLNKQAAAGQTQKLFDTLKSTRFIDEELKVFYQNFDSSFLSIFPHFVTRINELMPPDEQIIPHKGERLTTELRIFALIRLGITDSTQIAGFLRSSITTIYTYRSKMKNRSLCKDEFEEKVMKIGVVE